MMNQLMGSSPNNISAGNMREGDLSFWTFAHYYFIYIFVQ